MESMFVIGVLVAVFVPEINTIKSTKEDSVLSRHRRYIVFPEGASLSVAICLTTVVIIPNDIFSQGVNWGVSYNLPNDTSTFQDLLYPKRLLQRRHRRDLYQRMELILNNMGYNGRSCIFRALCEASRKLLPSENSVIEEFMRIIFSFPLQELTHYEPEEHRLYHRAYRIGMNSDEECSDIFPDCSFSLIDTVLGGYFN